jgi:hypothetical protein
LAAFSRLWSAVARSVWEAEEIKSLHNGTRVTRSAMQFNLKSMAIRTFICIWCLRCHKQDKREQQPGESEATREKCGLGIFRNGRFGGALKRLFHKRKGAHYIPGAKRLRRLHPGRETAAGSWHKQVSIIYLHDTQQNQSNDRTIRVR